MLLPPFDQLDQGQRLYRGNLHGHSTASDGEKTPSDVVAAYKRLGYDFICLSEHLWRDTQFCMQTVHDTRDLRDADFTTILGAELHCNGKAYDAHGLWHIVANGLPLDFAVATEDETGPQLVQRALDAGAFVSIAHPEWYGLTTEEARSLSAAHAVEVYTHACLVECDRAYGIAIADNLLNEGHRMSFTATDDSHFRIPDFGGGWVMVAADANDPELLVEALKQGRNYSSMGPSLNSIALDGDQLVVECSPAEHVFVMGEGSRSLNYTGTNLTRATFDLSELGSSSYFRVTVQDATGKKAWSNPYWR